MWDKIEVVVIKLEKIQENVMQYYHWTNPCLFANGPQACGHAQARNSSQHIYLL